MSIVYLESFDYYGSTNTNDIKVSMGSGGWFFLDGQVLRTEARTGDKALGLNINGFSSRYIPDMTTFFVGIAFYQANTSVDNIDILRFYFNDGDGNRVIQCKIAQNSLNGIDIVNGDGTLIERSAAEAMQLAGWNHFECKITLGSSTAGAYEVRINGSTTAALGPATGDTINTTATYANEIELTHQSLFNQHRYDDMHVLSTVGPYNNDFRGDCRVYTQRVSGVSGSSDWTRTTSTASALNYTALDETFQEGRNTTSTGVDYVYSNASGDKDEYQLEDLSTSVDTVFGVMAMAACRRPFGGTDKIKLGLISTSTEVQSTNITPTLQWGYVSEIQETYPGSTTGFTPAQVNSLKLSIEHTTST